MSTLDPVEASLRAQLRRDPYDPESLRQLGQWLLDHERAEEAIVPLRHALAQTPAALEIRYLLGVALALAHRTEEAAAVFMQVLEQDPRHVRAYGNLGAMLLRRERYHPALVALLTAVQLDPSYADAHSNLGAALRELGQLAAAAVALDRALALNPRHAGAWNNRGDLYAAAGQDEAAWRCFARALALEPGRADATYNLAMAQLARGELSAGWAGYEARKRLHPEQHNRYPYPHWEGAPLDHHTLLIYAEQGVGDELLFAHCYPAALAAARQVVIDCEPRLATLFARSFPRALIHPVAREQHVFTPPPCPIDVQIAAGSLPRLFRRNLADFPAQAGYLVADAARVARWRERLAALGPGDKIGFAWRSGVRNARRSVHYTELTAWGPLFAVPNVHWINLQYGECAAELARARAEFAVELVVFEDLNLTDDFDECAALCQALDLVIAPNIAVALLAAAVGTPTWLLGEAWFAHGQPTIPWYPTLCIPAPPRSAPAARLGIVAERLAAVVHEKMAQRSR